MKRLIRWLLRGLYRFRVYREASLKTPGPVLLVPNHVSWMDWLFIGVCLDEDWRFVVSKVVAETSWAHRLLMKNRRTLPVDIHSPYGVRHMAENLRQGGRLVLFGEGRISVTGSLMKLFDGTGFLLLKTDARVITAYVRGAERLPWVRHPGWTRWFPSISLHFSEVMSPPKIHGVSSWDSRQELTTWLRDRMVEQQFQTEMELGPDTVPEAIFQSAVQHPSRNILEDIHYQPLRYRRLLMGADLLRRHWTRRFGQGSGERIGVLLPNVVTTPVTLLSLWLAGRVPCVLNYATGVSTLLQCLELAGVKEVITSRVFLERVRIDAQELRDAGIRLIFLEDVRAGLSLLDKLRATFRTARLRRSLVEPLPSGKDPAVVLFTSGSEGIPKGVELSHKNILANIRQLLCTVPITDQERMFNALPLFHSFGLTVGTFLPLVRGFYSFLYPSPLHYRIIPNIVYGLNCTILMGTNTFLNGYARRAHPYDFQSIRYVFAGAEKLHEQTMETWMRRFGIRILEGYGATECSPVITVNSPLRARIGSTGRLLPGMDYRLEPLEGVERGGRLFVRGPNVMRGYLNTDPNERFQGLKGWYDTGDVAELDEEGFVYILGRLKRFAKVSGEMISLTAVEQALEGEFGSYGYRTAVTVLSRPDEQKSEVLVAVSNDSRITLDEIRGTLRRKGFSNLCHPREIRYIKDLPRLSTGKVDHRTLESMIGNGG